MRKLTILFWAVLQATLSLAQITPDGPTMGWSSWNTFRVHISDSLIEQQADAMVRLGLDQVGYRYINIDDGYFGGRDKVTGQLLVHPQRFPHGLRPVVDYIHALGLRAGIYSDAGNSTCGSYYDKDSIGVNVGLYGHDQQDCDYFFRTLGFDFIKVDFCGGQPKTSFTHLNLNEQKRYTAISQAIARTGKNVRFNVCRWNYPGTWVSNIASSWRTTHDISNRWSSVSDIIQQNIYLPAYSSYGHYNDMDMLEVGRGMTAEEDKTHFGMWCAMNSPLLIGCDMTSIKDNTLKLLMNRDLIAINQDSVGEQVQVVGYVDGCYVLARDVDRSQSTHRVLVVYNPSDAMHQVTVSFRDLCLDGRVSMRDLFEQKDIGSFTTSYTIDVPVHGCRIYRLQGQKRLEQIRYEAETAYISDYQEIYNNQAFKTGIYEIADGLSGHIKASWLGCSSQNDLCFRKVYSQHGGIYRLTIAYICDESRSVNINVNGKKVKTLTVKSNNAYTVNTSIPITIPLKKGYNEIRLNNAQDWMPDIDYIEVVKVR